MYENISLKVITNLKTEERYQIVAKNTLLHFELLIA